MNNAQQTARVGLFFLIGVALVWVTFETLSDGKILKQEGYRLVAGFEDLKELKIGDDVRLAGVRVGAVRETRLVDNRAEAVLEVNPNVRIPSDSVATIGMAGLIGNNYISIRMGSPAAPTLEPNQEIKTRTTPDLNTVMTQLGSVGDDLQMVMQQVNVVLGGGEKEGIFQRLNDILVENQENLRLSVANINTITERIRDGEGTIGRLVNDPSLYDELQGMAEGIRAASEEARTLVADARTIIEQVQSGQGTLGTLLYDESMANEIQMVARNLRELSDKLNSSEGTLGMLLSDDSLYREVQEVIRKADRAVDGFADQGPITAVGAAVNALF